jgi:hypothetical protein
MAASYTRSGGTWISRRNNAGEACVCRRLRAKVLVTNWPNHGRIHATEGRTKRLDRSSTGERLGARGGAGERDEKAGGYIACY